MIVDNLKESRFFPFFLSLSFFFFSQTNKTKTKTKQNKPKDFVLAVTRGLRPSIPPNTPYVIFSFFSFFFVQQTLIFYFLSIM